MPDRTQIPYLIRLLDDETPKVRTRVLQALRSFGPQLEAELRSQGLHLSPQQASALQPLLAPAPKPEPLESAWLRCFAPGLDETRRLESAFALIARYQEAGSETRLPRLLDSLAAEFQQTGRAVNALELNRFLFSEKGLHGAEADYYDPRNSNLVHVIEQRRGIPISLVAVFILVGKRLGITVHGCNVPGHFLARAVVQQMDYVFDCFGGGKLLTPPDIEALTRTSPEGFVEILRTPASAFVTMARVLRNLITAYSQVGQSKDAEQMRSLLSKMQRQQQGRASTS